MKLWPVITFVVLVESAVGTGLKAWQQVFSFPQNTTRMTADNAVNVCNTPGGFLGLPDDQTHRELLREALRDTRMASVWLALRKESFNGRWTWVNGIQAKPATIRAGTNLERCGAISLQETNLVPTDCKEDRNGFVCEIKGNQGCSVKHFTQACVQMGLKSYVIGCKIESWYKAREVCQRLGGDLAIVDKTEVLNRIVSYITDGKFVDSCSWVFIGLSKEDWKIPKTSGNVVPQVVNWTKGEPRQDSPCTTMHLSGNIYSWKSSRCGSTAGVMCQDYSRVSVVTPKEHHSQQPPNNKGSKGAALPIWVFIVIALLCVGIIALLVVAGYLLRRSRNTSKNKPGQKSDEEKPLTSPEAESGAESQSVAGQTHLTHEDKEQTTSEKNTPTTVEQSEVKGDLTVQEILNQTEKKIKVGVLSVERKSTLILKNSDLHESSPSVVRAIFDEYKAIHGKSVAIDEIVTILVPSSVDDAGKIKKVITRLKNLHLDVAYLHGMDPKQDKEILELLHEWRKETVLVCPGTMNKDEFPACETICVGEYGTMDPHQISTGVADFWVNQEEEPSRFAGLFAGIIKMESRDVKTYLKDTGNMRKFIIEYDIVKKKRGDDAGFGVLSHEYNIKEALAKLRNSINKKEKSTD